MANRMFISSMFLIIMILLFHIGGFFSNPNAVDCEDDNSINSLSAYTLKNLGLTCPENIGSTKFYTTILLLTTLSVSGIVIGSFVNWTPESSFKVTAGIPLGIILFAMLWDIIKIFDILADINGAFAMMIISPMMFAWLFTIYEFYIGRD